MNLIFLLPFYCLSLQPDGSENDLQKIISIDICNCIETNKDTIKNNVNSCYTNAFLKYQDKIAELYNLSPTSTYEESKIAGMDMRSKVARLLNQNCNSFPKLDFK